MIARMQKIFSSKIQQFANRNSNQKFNINQFDLNNVAFSSILSLIFSNVNNPLEKKLIEIQGSYNAEMLKAHFPQNIENPHLYFEAPKIDLLYKNNPAINKFNEPDYPKLINSLERNVRFETKVKILKKDEGKASVIQYGSEIIKHFPIEDVTRKAIYNNLSKEIRSDNNNARLVDNKSEKNIESHSILNEKTSAASDTNKHIVSNKINDESPLPYNAKESEINKATTIQQNFKQNEINPSINNFPKSHKYQPVENNTQRFYNKNLDNNNARLVDNKSEKNIESHSILNEKTSAASDTNKHIVSNKINDESPLPYNAKESEINKATTIQQNFKQNEINPSINNFPKSHKYQPVEENTQTAEEISTKDTPFRVNEYKDESNANETLTASHFRSHEIREGEMISPNTYKPLPIRISEIPSKVASLVQNSNDTPIKAEIVLHPKWLGTVIVEMNVIEERIEMVFKSENKETLRMLETQVNFLKEKLQNLGFEKQNYTFQHQLEEKENGSGWFSNKQSKQEDEELKRQFLHSFLRLRNQNQNFELNKWWGDDNQH